ncbi:MAG: AmmeMemoRadiSam system protein B, partial [Chloroflexi bacterium]|nr:AmmeMemoRadiSam system protein B [Chloroflexota bacterium]
MKPRVRSLDPQWIENNGQPALLLRDRLGLLDGVAVVPPPIAVLLSLCDGTRTVAELRVAFELRSGIPLTPTDLDGILNQLDQVLLLDSPRFAAAYAAALATYRAAPFRAPALAGSAYP